MKKNILYVIIGLIVIGAIAVKLSHNKKILDATRKPEDRTKMAILVNVDTATIKALSASVAFPAQIKAFDEAKVYAQTSGMITNLNIDLGQHVRKGEILGRLDTKILNLNLKQAEIDASNAKVNKLKLHDDYERANDLYLHKAGLQTSMTTAKNNYDNAIAQYDNAMNQINLIHQQIKNTSIISPLDGTISEHMAKNGEYVNPSNPIATITNINKLKTTVFVPQKTAYQLSVGMIGYLNTDVFNGKELTAKIIYISPQADDNHNYQIDLLLSHSDGLLLRAGTDVQVTFHHEKLQDNIVVPKEAVMTDQEIPYVYVVENGKAVMRQVSINASVGNYISIWSGLSNGAIVITNGQINLNNGSKVKIIKK